MLTITQTIKLAHLIEAIFDFVVSFSSRDLSLVLNSPLSLLIGKQTDCGHLFAENQLLKAPKLAGATFRPKAYQVDFLQQQVQCKLNSLSLSMQVAAA